MQIFHVDAFARAVFEGNPAAIVPLHHWLPDALMQKIAMENNLPDTAFFVQQGDCFLLRWFSPAAEVALCGHATLAAAHVLFEHLHHTTSPIVFQTMKSGDLLATKKAAGIYTLDFPQTTAKPLDTPTNASLAAEILQALGLDPDQSGDQKMRVGQKHINPVLKGLYDYLVVVDEQQTVEALKPNFRRLAQIPGRGVVITAPGTESDFVSRCFFPKSGVDEDPVTGSAHTMTVPFWAERLGKNRLTAIQLSARRGYLDCELRGRRVCMTGQAHTFLKGDLLIGGQR